MDEDVATGQIWIKKLAKPIEKIILKSMSTGNFAWCGLFVIVVYVCYKLSGVELKEVLLSVLAKLCWLGYIVGVGSIYGAAQLLKWREAFYQTEIKRVTETRDKALERVLELPLQSSARKRENT